MTPSVKCSLGDVCFGVNMVSGANDVWIETHPVWIVAREALLAAKLYAVWDISKGNHCIFFSRQSVHHSTLGGHLSLNSTLRITVSQCYLETSAKYTV